MSVSQADGQRKLSQILSEKRKKDPIGLLRAQRDGTLNEYLREDLAKRGLAVAGVPTPRKPASSASGTAPTGAGAAPGAAPVAPSVLASPGQRHSYKVPSPANKLTSAGTAGADGSAKPRGRLASLGPTDKQQSLPSHAFSSPPQASPQSEADYSSASTASLSSLSVSSSSAAGVRPRPGKLSASRFGSFQKTEEATAASSSALPKPPPSSLPNAESTSSSADASGKGSVPQNGSQNDSRSDSLRSSSGSRRWTVGPSSSPSAEPLQAAERTHGEKEEVETPSAGSSVTVTPPQTPPGEKAKSTGAGLQSKSGQSSPVYGKQGAAVTSSGTTRSVGKRSASGKIAALARRFEKQADVEGDIAAETEHRTVEMDSAAGSAEELKRHMEEAARQPEAVGEAPETEFPTEEAVPPTAAPTEESVTTTTGTKDPEEEQAEVEKESESIENGDGVDDDGGADDGGGGGGGGGWIASIATTMGFGGNASGEKATPEDDDDDDDDKSATKAKGVEADSAGGAAAGGVEEDVDAAIVDVSAVTKDGDEASVSSAKVLAEETAAPAVPAEQRDTSKGANGDGAFTEEFMERRRESIAAEMKAFLEDSDEDKGFSEREEDGDEDDEDDDGRELEVKVGGGEKGGKLNEPASDSASASAFDLTTVVGAAAEDFKPVAPSQATPEVDTEFSATHAKRVIASGAVLERKASITGVVPTLKNKSEFSVEDAKAKISTGAISERTRKLQEEQEALRNKHATERQDTDLPVMSAEMSRQGSVKGKAQMYRRGLSGVSDKSSKPVAAAGRLNGDWTQRREALEDFVVKYDAPENPATRTGAADPPTRYIPLPSDANSTQSVKTRGSGSFGGGGATGADGSISAHDSQASGLSVGGASANGSVSIDGAGLSGKTGGVDSADLQAGERGGEEAETAVSGDVIVGGGSGEGMRDSASPEKDAHVLEAEKYQSMGGTAGTEVTSIAGDATMASETKASSGHGGIATQPAASSGGGCCTIS